MAAEIAARKHDPPFREACADLQETLAFVLDPKKADHELARLLRRYAEGPGDPILGPRFEAVIELLSERGRPVRSRCPDAPSGEPLAPLLREGLAALLKTPLENADVLDPWAGTGELLAGLPRVHAFERDPRLFARLARLPNAALADPFRLPRRNGTPGFLFTDDENTERVERGQAVPLRAILTDLRRAPGPFAKRLRWILDRLEPQGVVAFLSDGAFFDAPAEAPLRATLERELRLVMHLRLEGVALTWLVRGPGPCRILDATQEAPFDRIDWTEREPTEAHVWRTEILRPEWMGFLPVAVERGAIFTEASFGVPPGKPAPDPGAKGVRRVLEAPFHTVSRGGRSRREPIPADGPTLVLLREPFGVFASSVPVDRRFLGRDGLLVGGRVSPAALRRFRTLYGAGVTDRDVFDAVLALLHHPDYAVRYHEDLRRSLPRLPLPESLAPLVDHPDAPPVGPGTAFGTGWLDPNPFEPGVLPEYDDPFASPYARADVDEGFLLLAGLGAALFRLRAESLRLTPSPLVRADARPVAKPRLSAAGTRLALPGGIALEGIPPEVAEDRIGRRTALEWALRALPEDDPEGFVLRVVASSVEVRRLVGILGGIAF